MAQPKLFEKCLREAEKLKTMHFSPEIDNLVDETIASILFKVLVEYDLINEGEIEAPARAKNAWKKRAEAFFRKWRDCIEVEKEKALYANF